MTRPTITAVKPAKGHTGGGTLIEITGASFAVSPPPPNVLPAPVQLSRVRVLFGGVEASDVEVADDSTLYCVTPIADPGAVDVVVQNLGETPATLLSDVGPFGLFGGETLELAVNDTVQTVTLNPPILPATATEVAAELNALLGVQVDVTAGRVRIRTDLRGPTSSIEVLGGTAVGILGLPTTIQRGTTDLIPIDEERTTAALAFEFVRPNLAKKGPVTLAFEQLMIELRRQVIENVNFASHSDFDLDTGDMLNTAMLAKLPGIVLADMQLPDSVLAVARTPTEVDGENGVTIVKEAEDLVDILVSAVVVSDDPIELVNLVGIMRRFARKNAELRVPVDRNDTSKGFLEYPLEWEQGTPINVNAQRGGDNLHTLTGQFSVRGVATGEMPIDYVGPMPAGVPQGADYESASQLGWPRTAAADVGVGSSS